MITAAECRSREDWQHTSALLAMLVNTSMVRDGKSEPARAEQFNPWVLADRERQGEERRRRGEQSDDFIPIEALQSAWVGHVG